MAEQAIRRLDLQAELPHEPPPATFSWNLDLPPGALWAVIAIAAAIMIYVFRDVIFVSRKRSPPPADVDAAIPGKSSDHDAAALGAADALAAAGQFAEAMHLLLLQALAEIRRRLDQQLADLLTSREILRNASLSKRARDLLRDLVMRVELSHFGHRPAADGDYAACRTSFLALARAFGGGA